MYSIYGGGASNIRFVREHNEAAQYIIDTNHWYDPRRELSKSIAMRVAEAKLDLTYDIMVGYGATQLIGDALERAKSTDRAKLIETLGTETFSETIMPYGPIRFVKGDNTGSQPRQHPDPRRQDRGGSSRRRSRRSSRCSRCRVVPGRT